MSGLCAACGWVHSTAEVRAIGRFGPTPPTYQATYPDAPVRATRDEAIADTCQRKAGAR